MLGDPLAYTRSPDLHRAGLAALGVACESRAIRTAAEDLGARLRELEAQGFSGVNLTHPHKLAALDHVARASEASQRARSINTVGFESGTAWGDTTDGGGFLDLLESRGLAPASQRVVLLGAGGAARSLALALASAGCASIAASARQVEGAKARWADIPEARIVAWRSEAEAAVLADATLVVNATPLTGEEGGAPIGRLPRRALVVDLVYGPEVTPWVRRARAAGIEALDGLGLLVFQARRSLALWTGREIPVEPLMAAVGWPR